MPKAIKQPKKKSRNANQFGYQLPTPKPAPKRKPAKAKATQSEISRVMSELGTKGGRIGGKRRLETMTPEERSQIALKAAKARWGNGKRVS